MIHTLDLLNKNWTKLKSAITDSMTKNVPFKTIMPQFQVAMDK